MKIDITMGHIQAVLKTIQKIASQKVSKDVLWKMVDLLDALDIQGEKFNRVLGIIQKEYFVKTENPEDPNDQNFYKVPKEREQDYLKEYGELLNKLVSIEIGEIKFEDFKEYEDLSLAELITIREFIFKKNPSTE